MVFEKCHSTLHSQCGGYPGHPLYPGVATASPTTHCLAENFYMVTSGIRRKPIANAKVSARQQCVYEGPVRSRKS